MLTLLRQRLYKDGMYLLCLIFTIKAHCLNMNFLRPLVLEVLVPFFVHLKKVELLAGELNKAKSFFGFCRQDVALSHNTWN